MSAYPLERGPLTLYEREPASITLGVIGLGCIGRHVATLSGHGGPEASPCLAFTTAWIVSRIWT